jgi:hydroxyacylglutathione hydrolase
MILHRLYDEHLAQASYLVGCAATGEAIVIDPNRDIDQYLAAAEAAGVRVTAVTETHIHADFVSGARELAARAAATLYLSAEGGPDWQYAFAAESGATLLRDGDTIAVGNVRLAAMHTPGHTPEHLAFVLTDTPATDRPMGVFTGDFVFVGDVGRPDLLEKAAGMADTMEAGARTLFRSLQRFKRLPDLLQIWPGHGAGSACGKGLSAVPQSTIGYERLTNWAFAIDDEERFVAAVLAGQPEPPAYFAHMKRLNRVGPRLLGGLRRPPRLPAGQVAALLDAGALVLDARHAADFAAGHVPGTLNIPLDRAFTTWAGWLVPHDRPFYLLLDDRCHHCLDTAVRELARIGLDQVAGYLAAEAIDAWQAAGRPLATVAQMTAAEVAARLADPALAILDVRGQTEWAAGRLPGARHLPLGDLVARLGEVPTDRTLVVHCQSGARSAIAASVLQAHGRTRVVNLIGGFAAWQAAGHPVERAAATAPAGG